MINSNWHPVSYRFAVIAGYCLNFGHCVLEPLPPLADLEATNTVHLKLIGKLVVDFQLVLIELFRYVLRLSTTSEHRLKIGVFAPTGSVWPTILGRGILLVRKLAWMMFRIVQECGHKFLSFCHGPSVWQRTHKRTDRQKGIGNTARCITCSCTVKILKIRWFSIPQTWWPAYQTALCFNSINSITRLRPWRCFTLTRGHAVAGHLDLCCWPPG